MVQCGQGTCVRTLNSAYLSSVVMDCKLRYTADMPPHAHGVAFCCCWAAAWLQRCMAEIAACYALSLFSALSSSDDTVGQSYPFRPS